jgi:DNA-binding response OmpR family regulator
MVVEDEMDVAIVLSKRLIDAGYEVESAPDAIMAMKVCREFKPDLVILDLMLPAGGGLAVLQNLRQNVRTNLIPVLILTGSKDEQLKQTIKAIGVDAYYEKPYDHVELIGTIDRLTKVRRDS